MKKINLLLRKCKSLSRQLGRSSSYSNLRSKSTREDFWISTTDLDHDHDQDAQHCKTTSTTTTTSTIFVGSTRKRYVISTKYLSHPLLAALINKSKQNNKAVGEDKDVLAVKCEVVLFDHLLWMLENADPASLGSESLEELAALYVF